MKCFQLICWSLAAMSAQVEGLNYFADTLLFGGVILSLARAMTAISPPSAKFTESMRNPSLRAV